MSRNIEELSKHFLGRMPLPEVVLSDNSLKLCGIPGRYYILEEDFLKAIAELSGDIENSNEALKKLLDALKETLEADLSAHTNNTNIHLSNEQIQKIKDCINELEARTIAQNEIASALNIAREEIIGEANTYTDTQVGNLRTEFDGKLGTLNVTDPETGENKPLADVLETDPQKVINSEYFYRFKNLIDNSSFEVFDGNTMIPIGWDNGIVSADASMFGTYSLKLTTGQTTKQTSRYQADATWAKGAYDTDDLVLTFYHKYDPVTVKVYDVENETYLNLSVLASDLTIQGEETSPTFGYEENWNKFRCMVKFTPLSTTKKIRVEFTCENGIKGECYIDAPSLEPYVEGEYPSIYKDGRFSVSAHQLINPPPADVDRFTALEHFSIGNSISDEKGNLTYQELLRKDGTLAIKREASNPDENGNYQTIVETFYKKDGATVNYVDTYSYTYSTGGAILTRTKTTTEVQ